MKNLQNDLAELLRHACDLSTMTNDETAQMLEVGDEYDFMAHRVLEEYTVGRRWHTRFRRSKSEQ